MVKRQTVQLDEVTHKKLKVVADLKQRSMAGQIRFFIDQELRTLREQGLLERLDPEKRELLEV